MGTPLTQLQADALTDAGFDGFNMSQEQMKAEITMFFMSDDYCFDELDIALLTAFNLKVEDFQNG